MRGKTMKQKYQIVKDDKKKTLIVREYAELDKDILSPLCEEIYELESINSAIAQGKAVLIAALRTKNRYPPGIYAKKIADAVVKLLSSAKVQSTELFFDDVELLGQENIGLKERLGADSEDIDDLLEEDYTEDYENKDAINKLNSSLKVADNEYGDVDEDA
jgi:hypothetical protein